MESGRTRSAVNDRIEQISSDNSIEFVKNRHDVFSYTGILGILAAVYYLTFDREEFLSNMENPVNLMFGLLVISYPIIRYWIPFHVYRLNAEGITLKNNEMLLWSDIRSVTVYDNYENEKGKETPVYRLELTIVTMSYETKIIKFSNYTIANKKWRKKIEPFLSNGFKMKDALVKIFMTFYERNRKDEGRVINPPDTGRH